MRQLYSDEFNQNRHIEDAVRVVAQAFRQLHDDKNVSISPAPTNCSDVSHPWTDGEVVLQLVSKLFFFLHVHYCTICSTRGK